MSADRNGPNHLYLLPDGRDLSRTPIIAVILVGMFWKRPDARAGSVGLIGGLAIQILVAVGANLLVAAGYLHPLHWLYLAFAAEMLTILLVIVTSLATAPASAGRVADLIWRPALVFGISAPNSRGTRIS